MTQQRVYRVYPSVVAPILLGVAAVWFAVTRDLWMLAALPFIALGSVCAAPNGNLADGFLAVLSGLIGVAIAKLLLEPLGDAIFVGSAAGWIGGVIEKRIRMKPEEEFNRTGDVQPEVGKASSESAPNASSDDPST